MTNREITLLVALVVFIATTVGLGIQVLRPWGGPMPMMHPGMMMPQGSGPMAGDRGFGRGPHGDRDARREDRTARMMAETDTNKDGYITRDEMLAFHTARMNEFFATVDTDKDGRLSVDELAKGRELMRQKMMARFAGRNAGSQPTQPQQAQPQTDGAATQGGTAGVPAAR